MKYFLDTHTCVYFLRGSHPALAQRLLSHRPDEIRIPSSVKAELLYGAERSRKRKENHERIRQFLLPFRIAAFGSEEAERYATIRAALEKRGTPIGPNDLIVAATAIANDGILVTNNEKEFKRVRELKLENWSRQSGSISV